MSEYLTEQEQIELLKKWLKQYSLVILTGVLLAIIGITSWRYYQQRQYKLQSHASALFDEMLTNRAQNKMGDAAHQADKLLTHYSKTPYASFAALMLARDAISSHRDNDAIKQFQWIMDHSKAASFRQIARIRLARLYLGTNQPQKSLDTLAKVDDPQFVGLIEEVQGDAYVKMNDTKLARQAYDKALKALPNAESTRPLLQMKYDNLATN